jgi:uncharacterized protein YjbI with pentapeptide repeats
MKKQIYMSKTEEDDKEKAAQQLTDSGQRKLYNALACLFKDEDKSLATRLLNDVADRKSFFSMGLKALWFGIRHPVHTYNLLQLEKNKEILQEPVFQKALLNNNDIWGFVENLGTNLPEIGAALAKFDIEIFKEGQLLDGKGLEALQNTLTNSVSQNQLREIAILGVGMAVNTTPLLMQTFELMKDTGVQEFFQVKKDHLQKFIVSNLEQQVETGEKAVKNSLAQEEVLKKALGAQHNETIQDLVKNQKESQQLQLELRAMLELSNAVKDSLTPNSRIQDIVNKYDQIKTSPGDLSQITEKLHRLQELENKIARNISDLAAPSNQNLKAEINKFIELEIQKNNTAALYSNLQTYGLSVKDLGLIYEIVPPLLNKPAELKELYHHFNQGNYNEIAKVALSLADTEPGIKKYFQDNHALFSAIVEKIIQDSPTFQAYNLSGKAYEIVPTLLEHPMELVKIIETFDKSGAVDAGKGFLDLAMSDEKLRKYFIENKAVVKGAMNQMGMEAFKVGDEVVDIVDNLMKSANLEKFPKLIDLYKESKWTELVIETCKLIEQDPEFMKYLQSNRENFAKIINAAVNQMPEVQKYLGTADVGTVISHLIKDPVSIRGLMEGVDQFQKTGSQVALASAGTRFIVSKALDFDVVKATAGAAMGWLFGNNADKQPIADVMLEGLQNRQAGEKVNLNDFLKSAVELGQISDLQQKNTMTEYVQKNSLFDGISITGKPDSPIILKDLEITGNKFVNTKFENVEFKDTKFTNVSFAGAKFTNVSFSGTEIDGNTLQSLIPALQNGSLSLEGAKIVGNLPAGLVLNGVSLSGADLSGVTSMKGVNLAGADLSNATLPSKEEVLAQGYNINKAKISEAALTQKVRDTNANMIISGVVSKLEDLEAEQKEALSLKLHELYKKDANFRERLESTPADLTTNIKLPADMSGFKNVADYSGKTPEVLDMIYNNRLSPEKLESRLLAYNIADEVTKNLFDKGANRGQDGLLIRRTIADCLEKVMEQNPQITAADIINSDHFDKMVASITVDIRAVTSYTTAGYATSGIWLPETAVTDKLKDNITEHLNDAYKFNNKEMEKIHEIAEIIGHNLFQEGADSSRKHDVDLIYKGIKEVVWQIKTESKESDISQILEKQKEKIAGTVENWGGRTGLTKVYYDATNYTSAGFFGTGGIYLKEEKAKSQELRALVKNEIKNVFEANKGVEIVTPKDSHTDKLLSERSAEGERSR